MSIVSGSPSNLIGISNTVKHMTGPCLFICYVFTCTSLFHNGFRYSNHETRKKRREAVYGKRSQAPNGSLRGAPQTLDIFVFRCDKETSCDRVKKYIEDNSTKVMDIKCVSSENARYRSFHVSVPRDSHDKVMDGEFWPEGVGVRYFKRRKSQFADNDSRNGGP